MKGEKTDSPPTGERSSPLQKQKSLATYKVVGISIAVDKIACIIKFSRRKANRLPSSIPIRVVDVFVVSTPTLFSERMHLTAQLWENDFRAEYHRKRNLS
jgi:histidyl-tRNA synthetase